jgi:hypothetical protein
MKAFHEREVRLVASVLALKISRALHRISDELRHPLAVQMLHVTHPRSVNWVHGWIRARRTIEYTPLCRAIAVGVPWLMRTYKTNKPSVLLRIVAPLSKDNSQFPFFHPRKALELLHEMRVGKIEHGILEIIEDEKTAIVVDGAV